MGSLSTERCVRSTWSLRIMTPRVALVTYGRYCVTVRIFEFECNVCNVNNVCIPTCGVLFSCFHDQHMVRSVLIEPKMSSGGRRAAEKSSSSLCVMKPDAAAGMETKSIPRRHDGPRPPITLSLHILTLPLLSLHVLAIPLLCLVLPCLCLALPRLASASPCLALPRLASP